MTRDRALELAEAALFDWRNHLHASGHDHEKEDEALRHIAAVREEELLLGRALKCIETADDTEAIHFLWRIKREREKKADRDRLAE